MKKNVMMRVAAILMVCVLATTCGISGTFAKYISDAEVSDTARVAKWGWGDTAITIDLFSDTYTNDSDDVTVDSANGDNVIAPGTSMTGELRWIPAATFAPEVDYVLSFAVSAEIPAAIEAELDWTLKLGSGEVQNFTNFADLERALEAHTYAGEASDDAPTVEIQIGWVWAFNGGDDEADTALGDAAQLLELTIEITMIATQEN